MGLLSAESPARTTFHLILWATFVYTLFMSKTKTTETIAHIRLPLKVALETQALVEAHLGVYVSKSTAVEWALQNHFLSLNMVDSLSKGKPE